ncbi:hypothetical protein C5E45_24715 [Nocardia nova]|uniref:Uncharacterized protein n=1 Tax=Nocardia nova TaxID=37330 RepID=A0A2S6AJX1_9NOCA|nr:hypothetical protein C5E41_21490 [Nocardia nova]PPJ35513.1 hypothetical protein C5E45_24715 [Nocardia nova]PSR64127.1 hypothetical protein C8259_09925 [Nocardia nova]
MPRNDFTAYASARRTPSDRGDGPRSDRAETGMLVSGESSPRRGQRRRSEYAGGIEVAKCGTNRLALGSAR